MVVEARHHLEQVLRRLVLVGEDECPQANVSTGTVIKPATDVRRAALLPTLHDERPDLATFCKLRLEPLVDVALRSIEDQRGNHSAFRSDLEELARKEDVVSVGLRPDRPLPQLLLQQSFHRVQLWLL